MKKALALLLALAMVFSLCACEDSSDAKEETAASETTEAPVAAEEQKAAESESAETGMSNPMEDVADYASLLAAQPTIQLNDAPVGATNVVYSVIHNIPAISQISFGYNGASYTYRAAFGNDVVDISGVYSTLATIVSGTVAQENMAGGAYSLRYDSTTGEAVANWGSTLSGCHYSLYSDCACKENTDAFLLILKGLYTCAYGARNAKGTVSAVMGSSLVIALEDGNSAVLDTSLVSNLTLKAKDIIAFSYSGDLSGTAYLISAAVTGTAEDTGTLAGNVIKIDTGSIFVCTQDNNVFYFDTSKATISGKANTLALYYNVTVTYTGDLYSNPVATNIEITNATAVSPTPSPTATPTPINRETVGTITSVAGNYVTVNSICFDVSGKIYAGTPVVGYTGDIYFTDYGNYNYVVTAAYFTAPQPVTYTISGTISSVTQVDANNYYFTISGYYIHLNTRGCGGDGSLVEGATGYVEYIIDNGVNEATYASFSAPAPTPAPQYHYLYGEVMSSGYVDENNCYFILTSGDQFKVAIGNMVGSPEPGASVTGNYYVDSTTGENIAVYAFFETVTPTPEPVSVYFSGTVTYCSAASDGIYFTLDNGLCLMTPYAVYTGAATEDAYVCGSYYTDAYGQNICDYADFYAPDYY